MTRLHRCLTASLIAALIPLPVLAATVQIQASRDNTLYQHATGALSNGSGAHCFSGRLSSGEIRRALFAFDIAANLPPSSTIVSATLTLHLSSATAGTQTIAAHRVSADWGEGASDAPGEEGGGTAASTGDATWVHRFFNTVAWTSVGGDFAGAASASQSVADTAFYSWTGPGLTADVQQWLDTPATNHGWILVGNEAVVTTAKRFDSRQNPITVRRPVLTVEYTPVVPGLSPLSSILGALALAGVAGLALRRRVIAG